MKVLCEGCGKELEEKDALVRQWLEERIYFCSKECEAKHKLLQESEIDEDAPDSGTSQ